MPFKFRFRDKSLEYDPGMAYNSIVRCTIVVRASQQVERRLLWMKKIFYRI